MKRILVLFGIAVCLIATLSGITSSHAIDRGIIASYSQRVVERLCSGDVEWLRCYGLDPISCHGTNSAIVDACVKEHVIGRTEPVRDQGEVQAVSDQLYNCILSSFHTKYDSHKKDTPECKDV